MKRPIPGRIQISSRGIEAVRAFIPSPLPPEPPLDIEGARQRQLEKATHALGRLESISTLLPDPHLFLYGYVRREAVLSSQIKGTQSSLSDLMLFELQEAPGVPVNDVVEVFNYLAALDHGMARIKEGFPLCGRLLKEMHGHLLATGRGRDKNPGEFRRSQNWIGGTRPGNAQFVPPVAEEVEALMGDLDHFINDPGGPPILVKAALAHYQFETIHPFLDGNGRLGRLLITLMLQAGGLLTEPLLYLSLYLKTHRTRYYELLSGVRTGGDFEAWIDFFLEGVTTTALGAVDTATRLLSVTETDQAKLQKSGRAATTALRVLGAFIKRPLLGIPQIRAQAPMSFPTASRAVDYLVKSGIIRKITGNRRNRVFAYDGYMKILSEGGEAL